MNNPGAPQNDEQTKEQIKQEASCLACGLGFVFGVPVIVGILVFIYSLIFG